MKSPCITGREGMNRFVVVFLCLNFMLISCVDYTVGSGNEGKNKPVEYEGPADGAIAVIGTDYMSTSVSIIDRETRQLLYESVIHSGSAPAGLSIALSGDVVMSGSSNAKHWLVLIDRFPNSVLTFLDPVGFKVVGQLPVATGFASNPHDFLWLNDARAYLTRYDKNPSPGRAPNDIGDDILIVNAALMSIDGSIPLESAADAGFQARPDKMIQAGELVWVTLNHLSGDMQMAGEGRILAIDPASDQIRHIISIPELTNCTGIQFVPSRASIYVSCSGLFAGTEHEQINNSGIASIDMGANPPVATIVKRADDDTGRPYGFTLADIEHSLLAERYGNLDSDEPDLIVAIDLESGAETIVYMAGSPYGLGGFFVDNQYDTLYVGEADPEAPVIVVYDIGIDTFTEAGEIVVHPKSGLPPRIIGVY
jgi:hypothetical protein